MGAYATDFVEKVWPLSYRGSPIKKLSIYPVGGQLRRDRPAGRRLPLGPLRRGQASAIAATANGCDNGKKPGDPATARVKALEGHFDPGFRGWDLDYPDVKRADRFIEELHRFEKEGGMPQLDRSAAAERSHLRHEGRQADADGRWSPTTIWRWAMVVEAVSKSKFWKDTAIFVIEDDAQNGPDHVDAHRTVALVISPYTKHGYVDSTMYSTSSMLRTMELILGLKPMSQFDAAARPMYNAFQAKPDLAPYDTSCREVDLKETNTATAWGAKQSEKFDFAEEDAVDDLLFNEVIWRSVKGPNSPMPPPVRAAFVMPRGKADKDDDD